MTAKLANSLCVEQKETIRLLLSEDVKPREILCRMKNYMVFPVCVGQAFTNARKHLKMDAKVF